SGVEAACSTVSTSPCGAAVVGELWGRASSAVIAGSNPFITRARVRGRSPAPKVRARCAAALTVYDRRALASTTARRGSEKLLISRSPLSHRASVPCCGSAASRPNALRSASVSAEVLILIVADLVAAIILTFGLYWCRHYGRDVVAACCASDVRVHGGSAARAASQVGGGVCRGLFGVLSITRLRSVELTQHGTGYYNAMLALGLIGGLEAGTAPLTLLFRA